jgi:hypothetical protein
MARSQPGRAGEDLSIVDGSGRLRTKLFVARPYPRLTAGTPVTFTRTSKGFTYTWNHVAALGRTEVFLPLGYSTGKSLRTTGTSVPVSCSVSGQALLCSSSQSGRASVTLTAP